MIDKIIENNGVWSEAVVKAFYDPPYKVRSAASGKYLLFGRSKDGRYLLIIFEWQDLRVRIITARDMTQSERRFLSRK